MKIGIVALVFVIASPALGNPQPAGKCSLIDDGVRVAGQSTSQDPKIISMVIPPVLGFSVVDVTFRINSDGTVANPKILCVSVPGSGIEAAVLKASKNWRFSPMTQSGKAVATDAAYRISTSGVIPLTFTTQEIHKIG